MKNLINYGLLSVLLLTVSFGYAQEKTPITEPFIKVLVNKDIDTAIEEYNMLKTTKSEKYDFSEKYLRNLALEILEDGGAGGAKKVFALNAENFPESSEANYYLGFVNYELGYNDMALVSLEKAYRLNKENKSARDLMQRIKDPKVYDTYEYVCGPCYCAHHDYKFKEPGHCIQCGMELVKAEHK